MKKTIIIGASTNPERYSYKAAESLTRHGHEIVMFGKNGGSVFGKDIIAEKIDVPDVDTITIYVNPANQKEWYDYILQTKPKRLVFNPGTENDELKNLAEKNNIQTEEACTLVLLSTKQY
ncbi:MAG: CoA-binding protein [Bacteroidota bacterium]|nr:CoA-binding protein [Bacteroidota bacterium]